jgi:tripartite-type tricarboxylate transporter receptor subunit TctC
MVSINTKMAACVSIASLSLVACGGDAEDNEYPSEGLTFVIPYEPGGGTDIIFRAAITQLEEEIGQPVVPRNVPGASATNGSREVKDSEPDGYTLLGTHETVIQTNIAGVSDYSYDAFEPVALLTETPIIATVGADTGWESADDFAQEVRDNPGEISWGVTTGSTSHFFAQMMLDELDLPADSLNFVNYVGTTDALTAVQSGEVAGVYADSAAAESQFESGAVTSIGVAHTERLEALPDAETFEEQGYDFTYSTARGVFAPEGTPPEIVEQLSDALEVVANDPEFEEQVAGFGTETSFLPHDEYEAYLEELEERYNELAEDMTF